MLRVDRNQLNSSRRCRLNHELTPGDQGLFVRQSNIRAGFDRSTRDRKAREP